MKNRNALIIFAKSPDAGEVKTRLSGHLDETQRLELYTSLLEDTVEKLRDVPGVDTFISYAGAGEYFGKFGLPMFPQSKGDLGTRMHTAIKKILELGYEKAVLVGVDIPGLTPAIVLEGFELLSGHDTVFGPALDGGYYLVGLKKPTEEIFKGVGWSTPNTLKQTLARTKAAGLKVSLTDILSDIDRPEDLEML